MSSDEDTGGADEEPAPPEVVIAVEDQPEEAEEAEEAADEPAQEEAGPSRKDKKDKKDKDAGKVPCDLCGLMCHPAGLPQHRGLGRCQRYGSASCWVVESAHQIQRLTPLHEDPPMSSAGFNWELAPLRRG